MKAFSSPLPEEKKVVWPRSLASFSVFTSVPLQMRSRTTWPVGTHAPFFAVVVQDSC